MTHRILLLNERDTANPLAGGAEVHTFAVFGALAARGHSVDQLAATFPGAEATAVIDGIRVRRLANRYLFYAAAPARARRLAREGRYDVVVDVLAKLPFLSPWVAPLPCLAIVHHLFGASAFRQVPFPIAAGTWLSERLIPPAYRETPIIAVSPSTKQDLIERGLPGAHIRVIPNGVDHSVYRPAESASPGAAGDPLLAWLGRVEPYKHLNLLLDAMVELRRAIGGVRLVVIGDGSGLADSRRHAARLGLGDCVEFAGFVDSARKVELLQEARLLVNTSEKEGWGLTVIEGNACGTPSVASDVPGLRDSVVDGETGVLVAFGDVGALARALVRVLGDAELLGQMSRKCVEWAARFTWEGAADDIERALDAVVAGRDLGTVELRSSPFSDSPPAADPS